MIVLGLALAVVLIGLGIWLANRPDNKPTAPLIWDESSFDEGHWS